MQTPPKNLLIGAHTSTVGGPHNALLQGQEIGATTIQLFTSNQKQWAGRLLTDELIQLWEEALQATGLSHIMSHASYLINLGAEKSEVLEKSLQAFEEEIERCHKLKITYLNFHPGAAGTQTYDACLDKIIKNLKSFENLCNKGKTRLLLETTAGQGTSVGHEFVHLGTIIKALKDTLPIGICIDTCHIFAAGYDIRTLEGWNKTLEEFEDEVGLEHLYAFHVNDSMKPLASHLDRHAHLGEGEIGIEAFKVMMTHPKLREIPKYLETPKGPPVWEKEITLLRNFAYENQTPD